MRYRIVPTFPPLLLALAILSLLLPVRLSAAPLPIVAAEYFIDADPGQGNGIPLPAADGAFGDSREEVELADVDMTGLGVGLHTLYVRMKSSNRLWGPARAFRFHVTGDQSIVAAEYFIDTDPGPGNGTPLPARDGAFNSPDERVELADLDTSGLPVGTHTLFVRMRDADARWGPTRKLELEVAPPKYIAGAEVFIDTDPGRGSGAPIFAKDGAFDQSTEELQALLTLPASLSLGAHTLYIRARDSATLWSEAVGLPFTVTYPPPTLSGITPNTGLNTGSVSITNLQGTDFLAGAVVRLTRSGEPDIAATDVTVVSSTRITCAFNLAGAAAGAWDVVVTNPDSQSATLTGSFAVGYPPPLVHNITPNSGLNTGSLSITDLAGSHFLAGATVRLTRSGQADIVATGVSVVSSSRITCLFNLTGAAAGAWDVVVTNPDGQSAALTAGFTVTSPVLDHFTFLAIGSPQTAGAPFSITLTARDQTGSVLNAFTGVASLSDPTGTLSPTTTGAFSGGVWTGNVALIRAGSGIALTASSAGKSGTTNSFTVNPGPLARIVVTPEGASIPLNGMQSYVAEGRDAYDNAFAIPTPAWSVLPGTGNGSIDASGLFQGTAPGEAIVRATLGSVSGSAAVSIWGPARGYGAWLSGKHQGYIDAIAAYNNGQTDPNRRILYLFPEWGHIDFEELSVRNRFGENGGEGPAHSVSVFYGGASELAGSRVYPLLSGTFDLGSLEGSQIEALAEGIADALRSDFYSSGLHLQIEPPASLPPEGLEAFYEALAGLVRAISRRMAGYPVTTAVWRTHAGEEPAPGLGDLFRAAYFTVLLNLDLAGDPDSHLQEASRRASDLMDLAEERGGYLLVGVPATATSQEHEWRQSPGNPAAREASGFRMVEYLDAGRKAATGVSSLPGYLGLSLWAFQDEPAGDPRSLEPEPWEYGPPDGQTVPSSAYPIAAEEWWLLLGMPVLFSPEPASTSPGCTVEVRGVNLGGGPPFDPFARLDFGSASGQIVSWREEKVVARVPSLPVGSPVDIGVTTGGGSSNVLAFTVAEPRADLVGTDLTGPGSAAAGSKVKVRLSVANRGSARAGVSLVRFYLSEDSQVTPDDLLLGVKKAGAVKVETGKAVSARLAIPASVPAGLYYLGALIDAEGQVEECDEGNNAAVAIPLRVTRPDLVVSRLEAPDSAQAGGKLSVSVSVRNQGDARAKRSRVQLYLSADPQLGGDDRLLGKKGVKALLPGEEASGSVRLKLPKDLAPGTYYLGAAADALGKVDESDETNNLAVSGPIVISGRP